MKKIIAIILMLLLGIGIIAAIYFSLDVRHSITVSGLIGSEKKAFFSDPAVIKRLKSQYDLVVDFEKVGSRRIATEGGSKGKIDQYDFAFPAGVPAAEKIRRDYKTKGSYRIFFTPMTIASWQPVVNVLAANNIVNKRNDFYAIIDMQRLLALMNQQKRWKDLPNNSDFAVGRRILIKSTDIRSSNSAAMYLSLASYLANQQEIVTDTQTIQNILPQMTALFNDQGFLPGSSATPFEDYIVKGAGNSPMVMIYEAQFLYQATLAVESGNQSIRSDMVLLYPEPTIYSQHIMVAMTDAGKQLGEALMNDEVLQKLAIKHGFRSNQVALNSVFIEQLKKAKLSGIPTNLNEVIDPPSYDVIEQMIQAIEAHMP